MIMANTYRLTKNGEVIHVGRSRDIAAIIKRSTQSVQQMARFSSKTRDGYRVCFVSGPPTRVYSKPWDPQESDLLKAMRARRLMETQEPGWEL